MMSPSYALNCIVNAVSSLLPTVITTRTNFSMWSAEMGKQGNIYTACLWILLLI